MRDGAPQDDLSIIDYTRDVWDQAYPEGSDEEFEASRFDPFDESIAAAVARMAEMGRFFKRIRHVVLDDEYLGWLSQTNQSDARSARLEYADSIGDDDVQRLWSKHQRDSGVVDYVHFSVLQGSDIPYANFPIPYGLVSELREWYSRQLGIREQDIYLHPALLSPDFYHFEYQSRFIEEASERFAGRLPMRFQSDVSPRPHHANMAARVLPIAIRYKHRPIYSVQDLASATSVLDRGFTDSDLIQWENKVQSQFDTFETILPSICLVSGNDVMAAATLIIAQIQDYAHDVGTSFSVE